MSCLATESAEIGVLAWSQVSEAKAPSVGWIIVVALHDRTRTSCGDLRYGGSVFGAGIKWVDVDRRIEGLPGQTTAIYADEVPYSIDTLVFVWYAGAGLIREEVSS